jgi:DNA-binding LytR/AlgR family response regulator
MKVLIVDDEPLAISRLKSLLSEAGVSKINIANDAKESLSIIEKNPDIEVAFLDIKMPGISGLELAYKITSMNDRIFIVFQTAYEDYSLEAFKIGAIDYILKPYTEDDIKRVLERVKKFQSREKDIKFMVKNMRGIYKIIATDDIYYIKAELKDSIIRTKDEEIYYPLSISKFEERLKQYGFFRIHKSFLININKVSKIESTFQSKLIFHFEGIKDKIKSSKEGGKHFRENFKP